VGRRKHGKPDPFRWNNFAVDERPATAEATASAIRRFVETFVFAVRRDRMVAMLLHKERRRREEGIQAVSKWIDPKLQFELEGRSGSPQHLQERFGELRGIIVTRPVARRQRAARSTVGALGDVENAAPMRRSTPTPRPTCKPRRARSSRGEQPDRRAGRASSSAQGWRPNIVEQQRDRYRIRDEDRAEIR
jgi:hypothetical protein